MSNKATGQRNNRTIKYTKMIRQTQGTVREQRFSSTNPNQFDNNELRYVVR